MHSVHLAMRHPYCMQSRDVHCACLYVRVHVCVRGQRVIKVPPGHVWLEGDNASNSNDSRYYGSVPEAMVHGRVVLLAWPPHRMRTFLGPQERPPAPAPPVARALPLPRAVPGPGPSPSGSSSTASPPAAPPSPSASGGATLHPEAEAGAGAGASDGGAPVPGTGVGAGLASAGSDGDPRTPP